MVKQLPAKTNNRKIAALWLLISPTVLIITSFILYAIVNLVFNPTMWPTADTEPLAATPIFITVINVLLFILGTVSVIAWLPGLIIGIILLTTTKK